MCAQVAALSSAVHLAAACRWLQEGRVICEDQVKTPFKKVKKRAAEASAQDQEVIIWDLLLLLRRQRLL